MILVVTLGDVLATIAAASVVIGWGAFMLYLWWKK